MSSVYPKRKGGEDFDASMNKLVSAFLAVADDIAASGADRVQEEKHQFLLAAGPAKGVVVRSDTPQQGATGRTSSRLQSGKRGRTEQKSA